MRAPIDGEVTPHGAYRYDRGGGVTHWGVDLAGVRGTWVRAPEAGTVVDVATSTRRPWTGYAPVVFVRGVSGWYHLLAHTWPLVAVGDAVAEGQAVGQTGAENHVHWEVRRGKTPTGASNTIDPWRWLAGDVPMAVPSAAGGDALWLLIILLGLSRSAK